MQSTLPIQLNDTPTLQQMRGSLTGKVALTMAASGFVALAAHVSLPLYFTPVPLTLQDMAVLLVGLFLGPAFGVSAMLLYLAEGAIGLPVFNPHGLGGIAQLMGPTGGYLLAYPLVAAVAGALVRSTSFLRSRFAAAILAGVAFSAVLFTSGASWLAHQMHLGPIAAWHLAVEPFLPGAILKISGAAAIYGSFRRWRRSSSNM